MNRSGQLGLFNEELDEARSRLSKLFQDAKLYETSREYMELLRFVGRFKVYAPFNAMMLHVQKPGLTYAASAARWRIDFGRTIKEGARPLLILMPFGPFAMVYDILDTEGRPLPEDALAFPASGQMDEIKLMLLRSKFDRKPIEWYDLDAGDGSAGWIKVLRSGDEDRAGQYRLAVNRNHPPPTRFTTIAHELAHLFLGHLGPDKKMGIPNRRGLGHDHFELEAESVAFLVCERNGVKPRSHTYLSKFVRNEEAEEMVDLYFIMRATSQIESFLGFDEERSGW